MYKALSARRIICPPPPPPLPLPFPAALSSVCATKITRCRFKLFLKRAKVVAWPNGWKIIISFLLPCCRDLRPTSLEKGQELKRLRFYAAYAWGGPLIVAGLAAILDHVTQSPESHVLRPHFGEKQCWFIGKSERARGSNNELVTVHFLRAIHFCNLGDDDRRRPLDKMQYHCLGSFNE